MWQAVELREIRVFLTLAEELHFARTAERLGLTQSRVSQTLHSLELKLGDRLVDRTSRRVRLTRAGEGLQAEVAPAYNTLLDVLRKAARSTQSVTGTMRLGVISAGAVTPSLLRVIDVFEQRHPTCKVEMVDLPFRNRHEPLRKGDIDLMVTRLPINRPDLVVGPVVDREARILAVARNHPLAGRKSVGVEDLGGCEVLDLDYLGPKEIADAWVPRETPKGQQIKRLRPTVNDFSDLVILIARGRIVHPTVASAASRFAHPDVVCIPIRDMPVSSTALAWRKGNADPRLHELVAAAREVLGAATASNRNESRISAWPAGKRRIATTKARHASERFVATILVIDLVASTAKVSELGDARWRAVLDDHYRVARRELERNRGIEIDTAGDGMLAIFDGPAAAIRCAWAIQRADQTFGLMSRAGVHCGEVERAGSAIRGIAVHVASRLATLGEADVVLVSSTARELAGGSGIRFESRGAKDLRGVPEAKEVFAASRADATPAQQGGKGSRVR